MQCYCYINDDKWFIWTHQCFTSLFDIKKAMKRDIPAINRTNIIQSCACMICIWYPLISKYFLKIQGDISRTTGSIPGLFVSIWIHFLCWKQNSNMKNIVKNVICCMLFSWCPSYEGLKKNSCCLIQRRSAPLKYVTKVTYVVEINRCAMWYGEGLCLSNTM